MHALAPLVVGHPEDGGVEHLRVTVQHVLDLGRVDVDARRDDHVALAVADVVEAVRVHVGHVAHRVPVPAAHLLGRLGIAIVLVEDAGEPAHVELARLAGRHRPAVVVEQRDLLARRRAPAGARLAQHVLRPQHRVHPELARAVELVEGGPEVRDHALLHAHRARRRRHDDGAHRGHVVARPDRRGQVDDPLEEGWGHEGAAAPVPRDLGQRLLRIELRHDDHGAADQVGVEREPARRRVVHRPGHQVHVGRVEQIHRPERGHQILGIDPAAQGPLGLPGGPAGIDDGRAEALAAPGLDRIGPPRGQQVVHVHAPGPALRSQQDPLADLLGPGANGLRHGQEAIAHQHRDRVGVLEDVERLLGDEPVIHRRGDEPGRARGRAGQVVLQRVLRVDDDVAAGRQPQADEAVAQPVAPGDELGPAPGALAFEESRLLGMPGGVRGEDVHRFRVCSMNRAGAATDGRFTRAAERCHNGASSITAASREDCPWRRIDRTWRRTGRSSSGSAPSPTS